MSAVTKIDSTAVSENTLERMLRFEEVLKALPDQIDPEANVTHHFAPGVYARELLIPAGYCIVGKMHREEHLSFLIKGTLMIVTDEGSQEMSAPCIIKAPAGVKRAAYAVTDAIWVCLHPNHDDERDMVKLEARYIVPTCKAIEGAEKQQCLSAG